MATTLIGIAGMTWPAFNALIAAIVQGPVRQTYFGISFALVNLGIGIGGLLSGAFVDVHRPGTFTAIYLLDAASMLIPIGLLLGPLRHVTGGSTRPEEVEPTGEPASYLRIARQPAVGWLLLLTFIATFVGYGQMEAGMPVFARQVSEVSTRTIGWAFAANTAVIVLCQFLVLHASPAIGAPGSWSSCAGIWATCVAPARVDRAGARLRRCRERRHPLPASSASARPSCSRRSPPSPTTWPPTTSAAVTTRSSAAFQGGGVLGRSWPVC